MYVGDLRILKDNGNLIVIDSIVNDIQCEYYNLSLNDNDVKLIEYCRLEAITEPLIISDKAEQLALLNLFGFSTATFRCTSYSI